MIFCAGQGQMRDSVLCRWASSGLQRWQVLSSHKSHEIFEKRTKNASYKTYVQTSKHLWSSILWTSPLPLADFNGRFPDFEIYYTIFSWLPPVFAYTKACPHPNLPFVICLILVDRRIKQYVYTVAQRRGSNCYDVRCNRPFRTPPNKCHGSKCHAWEMVLSILAAMAIASHNYKRLCQQIPVSVVSVRPCSTFSFQGARRCINILTTAVSILSTVRSFTTPSVLLVPDTAGPPKLSVDDF